MAVDAVDMRVALNTECSEAYSVDIDIDININISISYGRLYVLMYIAQCCISECSQTHYIEIEINI